MVLDIPGRLFGQEDVRETATSSTNLTGTLFWSASGVNFIPNNPDIDNIGYDDNSFGELNISAGTPFFNCAVNLPEGAVITEVQCLGNVGTTDETWTLLRNNFAGGTAETLATAAFNTADTSISNATIDNQNKIYWIRTTAMTSSDIIYGAKITYTLI